MNTKGYVYLIESIETKHRYLGSSNSPLKRIQEHNVGKSLATRCGVPWKFILLIEIEDIKEARKLEKHIKKQKEKLEIYNVIEIINKYSVKYSFGKLKYKVYKTKTGP